MTDLSTSSLTKIPCSGQEADILMEVWKNVSGELSDVALAVMDKEEQHLCGHVEHLIYLLVKNHPDYGDCEMSDLGYDLEVFHEPDQPAVLIGGKACSIGHVATFIECVLRYFDSPHLVEMKAAHIASNLVTDGYSGLAAVITKFGQRWHTEHAFLHAERRAHEQGERYFAGNIDIENEDVGWRKQVLFVSSVGDDPEQVFASKLLVLNGDGKFLDDTTVVYDGGSKAVSWSYKEISPFEFTHLANYLNTL